MLCKTIYFQMLNPTTKKTLIMVIKHQSKYLIEKTFKCEKVYAYNIYFTENSVHNYIHIFGNKVIK